MQEKKIPFKLKFIMSKERFSVWVGGIEVNDYYLSKEQAKNLAKAYKKDGYDDVKIVDNKN